MEREKLISLVTAAQKGNADALNDLFNAFYNDVYYFALKTVKNEDTACDVTQETFVEIINTLGNLQEPAAFVKWMKQITYHQCTRYFKKKKDVMVDEDEDGNTIFDTLQEDSTEFIPDAALDQKEFQRTILAMLDELSEEQRAAVMMFYYDELSIKQIAEIQNVSENTVKSRLNYARKGIKQSVEAYEKKTGIKLHSFGILPILLWLFKDYFGQAAPASAGLVAQGVTAATGTTVTAATTTTAAAAATATTAASVGIGAKIAALPIATKIIAGVVAAAVVAGSIATAVVVANRDGGPAVDPSATQTEAATDGSSEGVRTSGSAETSEPTLPDVPSTSAPTEEASPYYDLSRVTDTGFTVDELVSRVLKSASEDYASYGTDGEIPTAAVYPIDSWESGFRAADIFGYGLTGADFYSDWGRVTYNAKVWGDYRDPDFSVAKALLLNSVSYNLTLPFEDGARLTAAAKRDVAEFARLLNGAGAPALFCDRIPLDPDNIPDEIFESVADGTGEHSFDFRTTESIPVSGKRVSFSVKISSRQKDGIDCYCLDFGMNISHIPPYYDLSRVTESRLTAGEVIAKAMERSGWIEHWHGPNVNGYLYEDFNESPDELIVFGYDLLPYEWGWVSFYADSSEDENADIKAKKIEYRLFLPMENKEDQLVLVKKDVGIFIDKFGGLGSPTVQHTYAASFEPPKYYTFDVIDEEWLLEAAYGSERSIIRLDCDNLVIENRRVSAVELTIVGDYNWDDYEEDHNHGLFLTIEFADE